MSGVGVLAFSLSLPATRAAALELGAVHVGLGRALVASVLAAAWLIARGEKLPQREHLRSLLVVAGTVVLGFPLMTAYAMQTAEVGHGSVLHALVPLATAIVGSLRVKERLPPAFWAASVVGTLIAVSGAAVEAHGRVSAIDALLLASVLVVAIGYAEGGKLAMEMDGARVISWALLLSSPVSFAGVVYVLGTDGLPEASPRAWLGFLYVSVVSMFLGFFAWYRGLAEAGIARASQLQLVQPLLGVIWGALLLGERVEPATWLAAIGVLVCVRVAALVRA